MNRKRIDIWLDMEKNDERLLLEVIEFLKKQRRFVSTVRDGIRLMVDLRAGNLNVLYELFPWTQIPLHPIPPGVADDLLQKKVQPPGEPITGVQVSLSGPQPLQGGGRPVEAPRFDDDDDDDLVTLKPLSANVDAGKNFLMGLLNI
jgi:hypothetical protein